jgi:hypothetical protein
MYLFLFGIATAASICSMMALAERSTGKAIAGKQGSGEQ